VDASLTYTLAGVISGTGNLNLAGAGKVAITGANTFSGQTVVQSGTVQVATLANAGTPQPIGIAANPLVIGTAIPFSSSRATFSYVGASVTALTPITLGTGGGAIAIAASANLILSGSLTGGALIVTGPGTLNLTTTPKIYSGGTKITGGTVVVDQSSTLGT